HHASLLFEPLSEDGSKLPPESDFKLDNNLLALLPENEQNVTLLSYPQRSPRIDQSAVVHGYRERPELRVPRRLGRRGTRRPGSGPVEAVVLDLGEERVQFEAQDRAV